MSRKILLLKNGEIAPTPNLTFAPLGISSRECFFGTPGKRSRQIKKIPVDCSVQTTGQTILNCPERCSISDQGLVSRKSR